MKKLITTLVATVALTGGGLSLGTVAADAAPVVAKKNAKCITKPEFRRIHKGQTITRVKKIVGGAGGQVYFDGGYAGPYGWPAEQERKHNQCGGSYGVHGSAYVTYKKVNGVWKVKGKNAYWF
jgi:hypothetical protein